MQNELKEAVLHYSDHDWHWRLSTRGLIISKLKVFTPSLLKLYDSMYKDWNILYSKNRRTTYNSFRPSLKPVSWSFFKKHLVQACSQSMGSCTWNKKRGQIPQAMIQRLSNSGALILNMQLAKDSWSKPAKSCSPWITVRETLAISASALQWYNRKAMTS